MIAVKRVHVYMISFVLLFSCEQNRVEEEINMEPVIIPDRAFLYDLINLGIDTNGDSIISFGEAEAVTFLDITNYYGYYVTDVQGLEAFTNLCSLVFRCNVIDELDLSNNTALKKVIAYDNDLQRIDVSKCSELEVLHVGSEGFCYNNKLTSLNVSNNGKLRILRCGNNQLSELNVFQNAELEILECHLNQITDLDLSNSKKLLELIIWNNQISTLNVSSCLSLRRLDFRGNLISSIDLSHNLGLQDLDGCRNSLISLDISNNQELEKILLAEIHTLKQLCVWTLPFPPQGVYMDIAGDPGIVFTDECEILTPQ